MTATLPRRARLRSRYYPGGSWRQHLGGLEVAVRWTNAELSCVMWPLCTRSHRRFPSGGRVRNRGLGALSTEQARGNLDDRSRRWVRQFEPLGEVVFYMCFLHVLVGTAIQCNLLVPINTYSIWRNSAGAEC